MTQKTIFSTTFSLLLVAIVPCFLCAQAKGVIRGKVILKQDNKGIEGIIVKVANVKVDREETNSLGEFEFSDVKLKGGASVNLEFKTDDYILVDGNGYTRLESEAMVSVADPTFSKIPRITFIVSSKARAKQETNKGTEAGNIARSNKERDLSKKNDPISKQQLAAIKQNTKRFEETTERMNLANYSEDNATKSKAYQDAYNAVYNRGDMDAAFKILSDASIDAALNAAKDKYRAATSGTDEAKKKAAKAELEKAVSDCVLKARLCVIVLEYDKAVDNYRKAVYADEDDLLLRDEFANFLNLIGQGYSDTYEFLKARRAFQEAVDIREKLVKEDLGNEEHQYFKLLEAQNNLITLFREFNQMNEALEVYAATYITIDKYLDFAQRDLETPDPEAKKKKTAKQKKEDEKKEKEAQYKNSEEDNLLVLAQLHSNLGSVNTLRKDYHKARGHFENALYIFAELERRDVIKKNQLYLEIAQTCTSVGILYTDWYKDSDLLVWGETPIAAPVWFEKAEEYYGKVKDEFTSIAKAGNAYNYHQMGRMYHRLWKKNEENKTYAEKNFEKADRAYQELALENPKMFAPRRIKVLCDMFDFYITVNNVDKAYLNVFKKLNDTYEANKDNVNLEAFTPELADMFNHLGWIYHNKAIEKDPLHLDMDIMNQAKARFEQSKTEYERLVRMNDNIFLPKRAYCYINLSYYYYSLNRDDPRQEKRDIGRDYADKAIADLDKYFEYCKQFDKGFIDKFKDFEAEQYMSYAKEIREAHVKWSPTKKNNPKIITYNIYYPK